MATTSRKTKVFSLSLAQGILTVTGILSSMVFTRILTKDAYATYLQTFLAYDFVTPVLTLGLPSALYYFLPNEKNGKKVVGEVMLLLLLVGSLFSLFLICGGTELLAKRFNNPELLRTLQWMYLYPLYTLPVMCLSAILVINEKITLNSKYSVFTGIGLTVLIIIATFIDRDYTFPLITRIVYPLLIFPLAVYLCFKYTVGGFQQPNLPNMWKILKFSVPLGLSSTLASLALQFSNIIVSSYCAPRDYAIYAIGAKELPFISVITGSIAVVIMADMTKQVKSGNIKEALDLFRKASSVSSIFLIPVMIFLFLFGDAFIWTFFSDAYAESVIPFRIFLLYLPTRIVYYYPAFIAFGQSKAILFRTAIHLVLTVVLCGLFVWLFGYWGAAVGAIAASYAWAIPYNVWKLASDFQCRKRDVIPFRMVGNVLLVSFISSIPTIPLFFIDTLPAVRLCTGGIIFLIAYYLLMKKYINEFNELTKPIIKKITKK